MSLSHHGSADDGLLHAKSRLLDQMMGTDRRAYSAGRMGDMDDGDLSYAMANDQKNRTIIIRFGKPIEWIGLGVEDAERLRDELTERIMALKGTAPSR